MSEVTVSGVVYRIGRLTPKQQLHIARRLAPLAVGFKGTEEEIGVNFAEHLAKMSDAEVDAIVDPSLLVCQRKMAEGAWSPITTGNGQLMYEDIQVKEIFELTIAVLKENLGNFFPGQGSLGASASAVR